MNFTEIAKTRQSCRKYNKDKAVENEKITAILEAARLSPSACNGQPYFITVCKGEKAKEVAKATMSMGMNKFAADAPVVLVISEMPYCKTAAAQLAVIEFVKSTLNVIFLLNRTYIPYYKWVFRTLKALPILSNLASDLEALISTDNSDHIQKSKLIEKICGEIKVHLENNALTTFKGDSLEAHAYSVNNKISDHNIRNLHILYAV